MIAIRVDLLVVSLHNLTDSSLENIILLIFLAEIPALRTIFFHYTFIKMPFYFD